MLVLHSTKPEDVEFALSRCFTRGYTPREETPCISKFSDYVTVEMHEFDVR